MFIPGYKLERKLGQGGMAVVYLAIQESLQRPVALKVLNPVFSDTPAFSERFLNEGRILASLSHNNIITIHDIGVVGDLHYISMEYVEGSDLRGKIKQGVSPDRALGYVSTIASCLAAAHEKNIVHRDIKPANILFRNDDTLLLTDFGIAKRMDGQDITEVGTTLGSPSYLSPEAAQSKEVDGRSDIYGVGIILFEMLTGSKPYRGETDIDTIVMHINDPTPSLPEHLTAYQPLLDRMIAKDPRERFATAAQIVDFIEDFTQPELVLGPSQGTKTFFTRVPDDPSTVSQDTKTLILRPGDGDTNAPIEPVSPPHVDEIAKPSTSQGARRVFYATAASITLLGTVGAFGLYQQHTGAPAEPHDALAVVEHPDEGLGLLSRTDTQGKLWESGEPSATVAANTGGRESAKDIPTASANTTQADSSQSIEEGEPTLKPPVDADKNKRQSKNQGAEISGSTPVRAAPDPGVAYKAPGPPPQAGAVSTIVSGPAPAPKPGVVAGPPALEQTRDAVLSAEASAPPKATAIAQAPTVATKPKPAPAKKAPTAPPKVAMAKPTEIVVDDAEVKRLLGNANAAIAANRLTDPRGHNALDYYRDALELDPENSEAQFGFTRIGNRYAWLAQQAFKSYENKTAENYIKQGLEVDPYNRRLLALRGQMEDRARELSIVPGSNRFQEESNDRGRERKRHKRVGETPGALVHRIKKFFN